MVESRLILEPEVQEIFKRIDKAQNFLLSGGAGSGKTYSLVQVIKQVINENPRLNVACMTYTNAAVKEIRERVNHSNLFVSTIHDFLWDNIKHFQKELKLAIINLANDEDTSKINIYDLKPVPNNYFDDCEKGIQYKEYLKLKTGIISHDELLIIANYMFKNYPKLSDIVRDKYNFIFIDEYQDTNKAVIQIFLEHFTQSRKQSIIGFFGDSMQSIYPDGVGNIDDYKGVEEGKVQEIKKKQNRRNPQKIINLANILRTDGIIQVASIDEAAPNMLNGEIRDGKIKFIYSVDGDIEKTKHYLTENMDFNFSDSKETKELNLTHNLIADKAGFRTLMDIYDRDLIISYRDRIKNYIKIHNIETDFSTKTFGQVVEDLKNGISTTREMQSVLPTSNMQSFISANPHLFQFAKDYNYSSLCKLHINKDQLLDDKKQDEEDENKTGSKRDYLIKHLFKIEHNISLYKNKKYNEFLRVTDFRTHILSIENKRTLKNNIEELVNIGEKTIEKIINDANDKGICLIDDNLIKFKAEKEYLYRRVKNVKYSEFQKLFEYLEGKTPFSTQHKTKGAEFNNVLVILDNGGWNNYNFENLFLGTGSLTVLDRSQKIFYVCCTRAKENLVVFYHSPAPDVIEKAKEWFGEVNVLSI